MLQIQTVFCIVSLSKSLKGVRKLWWLRETLDQPPWHQVIDLKVCGIPLCKASGATL